MIVSKAVQCARRNCRRLGHQNINTDIPIEVENCRKCGGPQVMYLGGNESIFSVNETLEMNDLVDLALAGSAKHNKLFRNKLAASGYKLLGFHGCGRKSAASIIGAGIDVTLTKNRARGKAFYIGNHYNGLAMQWSRIAAHREESLPIILAVFTNKFSEWRYSDDFDWGKMDEDDDENAGLEMAIISKTVIDSLRIGPAIPDDEPAISWVECPKDSMSCGDRATLERAARELGISYQALLKKVLADELSPQDKKTLSKYELA